MEKRLQTTVEGEKRYALRGRKGVAPGEAKQDPQQLGRALLSAAGKGNDEAALVLLANETDVNFVDRNGSTALHAAVKGAHRKMVSLLVRWGANVNIATKRTKLTPLHLAADQGEKDMIRELVADGADCNLLSQKGESALTICMRQGHLDSAKVIISNSNCDVNRYGSKSDPALYWAVWYGDAHMVQLLLGVGANPDLARADGQCPLVAAVEAGHRSISKMLLSVNATWKITVDNDVTVKELAEKKGLDDVVLMMKDV